MSLDWELGRRNWRCKRKTGGRWTTEIAVPLRILEADVRMRDVEAIEMITSLESPLDHVHRYCEIPLFCAFQDLSPRNYRHY